MEDGGVGPVSSAGSTEVGGHFQLREGSIPSNIAIKNQYRRHKANLFSEKYFHVVTQLSRYIIFPNLPWCVPEMRGRDMFICLYF